MYSIIAGMLELLKVFILTYGFSVPKTTRKGIVWHDITRSKPLRFSFKINVTVDVGKGLKT